MTRGSRSKKISVAEMMKVPPHRPKAMIGCRHIQAIMMTLGFFCCYAVRAALSISLVAMTNAKSANPNFKEYEWEDSVQDLILSSFFWGYVATHIPGGLIAQRWGVHGLYTWAMMLCGVATILIPIAADYGGWAGVCVCRVISGACQGIVPPVLHTLLSKWVPIEERGRFGSFTYTGGWVGNVAALLSCGIISGSSLGWPSCFYIWGGLTIAWSTAWFFIGKESPADHPNIPHDEKEFIEVSLGVTETSEVLSTPWLSLLTSGPLWALLIAQCTQAWGFWMLLTKTPMYMDKVLKYPIAENGRVSALPYFTAWVLSFPVSYIADLLIRKKITSLNTSRKACNSLGEMLPAIALIGLGFIDKDKPHVAVALLTISVASNVAIFCGHQVNHMDLSPNYSGTLMGITNGAANVCSILAPIVAGAIIHDKTDVLQWRKVFILSAIIYTMGSIVFALFGSTTVQPWNESTSPPTKYESRVTMSKIPEDPSSEKTMNEKNNVITSDNSIARVSSGFFNPRHVS
ncbi:putative inorganic phosphate cotransporter [Venturia canescens]|uniref:putative inorganic phosphate cotransporter n=1 Tax=Venturia canescens TaxID=32260 RepID=UPI001C9C0560|nr:putative inorganic phosphate cotransporter [Venturia canescens]XP_043273012.1 putative inorganic phosphate cotransporter [Venturia canescens]